MEFFRQLPMKLDETSLRETFTLAALPQWCEEIYAVKAGEQAEQAQMDCLWGRYEIRREPIRGGLRFMLPTCPNALQFTLTTGFPPAPAAVMLHCTINRPPEVVDPDFAESLDMFMQAWRG